MPASKKPLDEEVARRSICRDHTNGADGCARKSRCKFNHDLIEMGRVEGLLGDLAMLRKPREYLTLEYVGAPRASGQFEGGFWRVTLWAREVRRRVCEMPEPFVAEGEDVGTAVKKMEEELMWDGYSTGRTAEKRRGSPSKITLCKDFQERGECGDGERCKYSHSLVDFKSVRTAIGSPKWYGEKTTFVIVHFAVEDGNLGPWKISLKAMSTAHNSMYTLPVPSVKTGENLFAVLRHLGPMLKGAENAREQHAAVQRLLDAERRSSYGPVKPGACPAVQQHLPHRSPGAAPSRVTQAANHRTIEQLAVKAVNPSPSPPSSPRVSLQYSGNEYVLPAPAMPQTPIVPRTPTSEPTHSDTRPAAQRHLIQRPEAAPYPESAPLLTVAAVNYQTLAQPPLKPAAQPITGVQVSTKENALPAPSRPSQTRLNDTLPSPISSAPSTQLGQQTTSVPTLPSSAGNARVPRVYPVYPATSPPGIGSSRPAVHTYTPPRAFDTARLQTPGYSYAERGRFGSPQQDPRSDGYGGGKVLAIIGAIFCLGWLFC